jgi:hypothetical protein
LVLYALGTEALCIAYIFLAGLFTLETLLPTFVTTRLSLSAFFAIVLVSTFILALLGRYLGTSFPWTFTWKSPLILLGILWATGILGLSLLKFPWVTLPLFLVGFLVSGYLFWQVLFGEEK